MRSILNERHRSAVEEWVNRHAFSRFVFSHACMAFFYGAFLFLYELKYFRETIPVVHPVLIAWAGLVVAYDFLIRRSWTKLPGWKFLVLFCFVTAITVVLSADAGLVGNIKGWVLTVLPLFAFYPVCQTVQKGERTKVLLLTFLGAAIVIFAASAVSLFLYIFRFGGYVEFLGVNSYIGLTLYDPNNVNSGLLLFGVFCDPNHAAMYAIAFGGYSVILFNACRKGLFACRWQNVMGMVFAVANLIVQACYFPLANSRGGWLCLCIASVIVCFLYFFFGSTLRLKKTAKAAVSVLLCLTITAVMGGGLLLARAGMTQLSASILAIQSSVGETTDPGAIDPEGTDPEANEPPIQDEIDIAWGDFEKQSDEFGAGRISLWKEALTLFTKRLLFGGGTGNSQYYANYYSLGGLLSEGKAIHNSYLDLLVDYGIAGFVLLMGFFAVCLFHVVKRIVQKGKELDSTYFIASMVVLMTAGVALLLSCAFINTTAMYFLLLVMTGYLVSHQFKDEVVS